MYLHRSLLFIAILCAHTFAESTAEPNAKVRFENRSGKPVDLYWHDDINEGNNVLLGSSESGESIDVSTYFGHKFFYAAQDSDTVFALVSIVEGMSEFILYPEGHAKMQEQQFLIEKIEWMADYKQRTGREWKNYYPRGPVKHYYHNATQGQVIKVTTDRTKFHICKEGELNGEDMDALNYYNRVRMIAIVFVFIYSIFIIVVLHRFGDRFMQSNVSLFGVLFIAGLVPAMTMYKIMEMEEQIRIEDDLFFIGRMNDTTYCRPKIKEANVTLDVVNICAHGPHAFRIYDFLSEDEMEHIKNFGMSKGLKGSTLGEEAFTTSERTSQTAWISRDESFIVDNIVRRIADVVRIPQEILHLNASSETLQLVHYFGGEWYRMHYDYEVTKPHSRYITFLMYLNDVSEGGNTSFPQADDRCRDANGYFGVQPIKGSIAFFYNLFPDGNVDTTTLHQGERPMNGSEKWMTNLWIWDEVFTRG